MKLHLLYFAWVRETLGIGDETVDVPSHVITLQDLILWLASTRADAKIFEDRNRLRFAIDQRFVDISEPIAGAREVAIFPPVTGG